MSTTAARKKSALAAGLLGLLLQYGVVEAAQPAATMKITISAQPLAKALNEWANQTGYQVLMSSREEARGRMAPALSGSYTPEGALKELLADSGLKYEFVAEKTVSISSGKSGNTTSGVEPADQMRVAASGSGSFDPAAESVASDDSKNQVTVEGQRDRSPPFSTGNLDLTRTQDDVLPFQVFTAREVEL